MKKRYVLEVEFPPEVHEEGLDFYKVTNIPWWMVSNNILNKLEPLTAEYVGEHFWDLHDYAYQKGREDGRRDERTRDHCESCVHRNVDPQEMPCAECCYNWGNQYKERLTLTAEESEIANIHIDDSIKELAYEAGRKLRELSDALERMKGGNG